MAIRSAEALWEGNSREGKGKVKLGSGLFEGPYTWPSRFEQSPGTNPEELIAAAHAGCFSMAFASGLTRAGYAPKSIHTVARVHIDRVDAGWKITQIELQTVGVVPEITENAFLEQAEAAKKGCPVSQALAAVEIVLSAKLQAG
jgi:lipoyl-dependent peroxiredoxin